MQYFFQQGGEDPNTSSDFFNGLIDMSMAQQNESDVETPQEEQAPTEEYDNEFLQGLSEYAKESNSNDLQSQIDELKQQLNDKSYESSVDTRIQDLEEQLSIAQFYGSPDGEDYVMGQYEAKPASNNETSAAPASKYTPVESSVSSSGVGAYNVGNIRDVKTGKFKQFASAAEGEQALMNQLNIYQTGKSKTGIKPTSTLYQAMAIYAPASDNNNPKQYAEFIAKKMGVSPNTPINQLDPKGWAAAIKIMEGNTKTRQMGGYVNTFQGGRMGMKPTKKTNKYTC